jgi:hypothetical protein
MIDASIPLSGKTGGDPFKDALSQLHELRNSNLRHQVLEQQLAQGQRAQEEAQALRGIYGSAEGADLVQQLNKAGYPDQASAYQKQLDDRESRKLDLHGKIGGLLKQELEAAYQDPTEANIIGRINRLQDLTGQNMDHEKARVFEARNNPDALKKYVAGHILSLKEQLPTVETKDIGGELQTRQVNPLTGEVTVTGTTPKTQSPDSLASNEVARGNLAVNQANLGLAKQRLALDQKKSEQDSIAQKKLDMKVAADAKKEALRTEQNLSKADLVIGKVGEALDKTGFSTSGFTGKVLSNIAGTPAYDLDKTIDTIKANIGFNELAAMREASPTGGALGQIAVRELDFLQAALGSLDVGQSEKQQRENLQAVKTHYENWKRAVKGETKGASGSFDKAKGDDTLNQFRSRFGY